MIPRYSTPEMRHIWSPEYKFQKWLEVEIAVCEGWAHLGQIPPQAVEKITSRASFSVQRIEELEEVVRHDVIAFLTNVAENVGEEARYIHLGLTSSDILDTSMALLLREACQIILQDLEELSRVLQRRALEHKDTPMIGRTHGIHAEPITFGLKLAIWWDENRRNIERLKRAIETINYGKISGAVGSFAHVEPSVEEYVCRKLGLKPAPISSQIIQRDRYAELLTTLAIIASSVEKFATEIRNLQRTDIREVEEYFSPGQKGSSAMPHKRNPIACEQVCGLARLVRTNSLAALENMPLWHERDITHSSVERVILPDSTTLIDYILKRFTRILDRLLVYPDQMMENLNKTRGLIFSESILLALIRKGLSREEAYQMVQRRAMEGWKGNRLFKESVLDDEEIGKYLSREEIDSAFDLREQLRHVDHIFDRVFPKPEGKEGGR